ncbi:hypothetical protein COX64_05245 [Candidatus Dojkabacteria bacterium CG_4_10_14_0_2_um_filter_Dojkabacteria_WS6_41_15]|uniref:histidine kinase n=1 Tax=Candidatus Dojkabacteria bacterium CG_4_10_14_0_2_um_filter_Dojkabacteria_WS6_41_15 TaxID=2014249 RepID=A0A2M7W0H7_9BACT|nr:MAG: hypothetical protein COX64_05245 [Candidatus Dojkabacteria bacterium CG_4_10_14_0_2_um_filter_Dojkabacteria_WS6_41_15]
MIAVAVITLVGVLNLILGLTTLLRAKREASSFFYFLITIVTVLWILPLTLLEFATTDASRLLWAKSAFIGPSFLPLALYGFISNFPSNSKNYQKSFFRVLAIAGAFFLYISLFGKHFITGVTADSANNLVFSYGYQYAIYFTYLAGSIVYLLGSMYKRYKQSEGLDQLRLRYLLTGFGLSAAGALLTNMVLPMLGLDVFSMFGPVSTIFLFYFTTQAIIYHRLFDIGTFVANLVEVISLAIFYYLVIFVIRTFEIKILGLSFYDPLNIFIDLVFSFAVALNIKAILKAVAVFVGSILVSEKIDFEDISLELDQLRTKNLSLADYLQQVATVLNTKIPKLRAFLTQDSSMNEQLHSLHFSVGLLYLLQEINPGKKQHIFLKSKGYGLLIRISPQIALILYEKNGQFAYTRQEIDAISYLSQKLKISLAERTLLEQTNSFNSILQRKVAHQTIKLTRANRKLKELDKAKSDFISMASHQLRTPISVIKGYLSMILNGDLGKVSSSIIPSLERVLKNTDQLNNIVEDILNASRIEQSRLIINCTVGDLAELTRVAVAELTQKATDKKLNLETSIPKKKVSLSFDQTKIYEAIINLIDNAITYTTKGSITVSLTEKSDHVTISVKDSGIGIPQNKKDQIFKRFSRLDNAKLVRPDGTGIGLYIAKKIVDAHSGKIWFESTLNVGTTFTIQLPKHQKSKTA